MKRGNRASRSSIRLSAPDASAHTFIISNQVKHSQLRSSPTRQFSGAVFRRENLLILMRYRPAQPSARRNATPNGDHSSGWFLEGRYYELSTIIPSAVSLAVGYRVATDKSPGLRSQTTLNCTYLVKARCEHMAARPGWLPFKASFLVMFAPGYRVTACSNVIDLPIYVESEAKSLFSLANQPNSTTSKINTGSPMQRCTRIHTHIALP